MAEGASHTKLSLLPAMQKMLETRLHCDVHLMVEGRNYPAHKVVLAARSNYFSRLFLEEPETREVDLHNFNTRHLNFLLCYCYEKPFTVRRGNIFDALFVATTMGLCHLEEQCSNLIKTQITVSNFVTITNEAMNFRSARLLSECMIFFQRRTGDIVKQKCTNHLQRDAIRFLLETETISNAGEVDLFNMLWRWGRHHVHLSSHRNISPAEHVVAYIGDIIHLIQLSEMMGNEFASYVVGKSIMSKEKEHEYLLHFMQADGRENVSLLTGEQYVPRQKLSDEKPKRPLVRQSSLKDLRCAVCASHIDSRLGQEWVRCHQCPEQHLCLPCAVTGQHNRHARYMEVFTNQGHDLWCSLCGWDMLTSSQTSVECRTCKNSGHLCEGCHTNYCGAPLLPCVGKIEGVNLVYGVTQLEHEAFMVTDYTGHDVLRYTTGGEMTSSTTVNNIEIKHPTCITHVTVDGITHILVCEWATSSLLVLSEALDKLIRKTQLPMTPVCMTGVKENIVVGMAEGYDAMVEVYDVEGKVLHKWRNEIHCPVALATTADDQVIMVDKDDIEMMSKHALDGEESLDFITPLWTDIRCLAGLPDGNILVAYKHPDTDMDTLRLINSSGDQVSAKPRFMYKKEFGHIRAVCHHENSIIIAFDCHVAIYKLCDLFPVFY